MQKSVMSAGESLAGHADLDVSDASSLTRDAERLVAERAPAPEAPGPGYGVPVPRPFGRPKAVVGKIRPAAAGAGRVYSRVVHPLGWDGIVRVCRVRGARVVLVARSCRGPERLEVVHEGIAILLGRHLRTARPGMTVRDECNRCGDDGNGATHQRRHAKHHPPEIVNVSMIPVARGRQGAHWLIIGARSRPT